MRRPTVRGLRMVPHLGTGCRTSIGDHLRRCRGAHHPRATRRRVPNPSELGHPGRSRSDVRLKHHRRSEQAQLALERRVAARVGVLLHQLMTQVGAPDRRAKPQDAARCGQAAPASAPLACPARTAPVRLGAAHAAPCLGTPRTPGRARSPSSRDGAGLSIPSTFLQTAIGSPLWLRR